MQKLSVVFATYNEEKNLRETLISVKDLADEIIVVDGSSSDNTVSIAKEFGAKVVITTNPPIFHINKQKAIDLATKDWVLQLDADEHVSKELKKEIRNILKENDTNVNGYWMPRKNFFLGRFLMKGGQYPDYTLRLYRRGKGRLPQKSVHEQAVVEGSVRYLKTPLLHMSDKHFSRYLKRWGRYTDLIAKEFEEQHLIISPISFIKYIFVLPTWWFLLTYIRHKGFIDSWQGFVFSFFSALRFPVGYSKHLFKNKAFLLVLFIIFFATLLRIYNFYQGWEVGGDSARDILIAREAIERRELPLIGHFSSAGPIIQGPLYYWLIILSYILFPFSIISPWVMTLFIGILTVLVLMYCGKLIGGTKLAILVGILSATSPQLVIHSVHLTNPTFVITAVAFLLLFTILFYQRRKIRYAFFMGLSIGAGISFHYQSLNLLLFFITVFFVPKTSIRKKFIFLLVMFLGLMIVSFPLLYWDSQQQWANIRNILDYFLIGQYRLYVPNSWRLFLLNYLPTHWAFMVGGYKIISTTVAVIVGVLLSIFIYKRSVSRVLSVLILIFGIFLLVNRYYHGERTEGYMLYLLPFIILFTSWALMQLIYPKKLLELLHIFSKGRIAMICMMLGYSLITVVLVGNILRVKQEKSYQAHTYESEEYTKQLVAKYPTSKFALYDYKPKAFTNSATLIVFLEFNNKLDEKGMPLSFINNASPVGKKKLPIALQFKEFRFINISKELKNSKTVSNWRMVNQASIYDELIDWTKKRKLISTFSLSEYIKIRLGIK